MEWADLIKKSLLGTEKMPPSDESALPEAIRHALASDAEADREARFLKTAALVHLWHQAGRLPEKTELPPVPLAPPDTLPFCGPAWTRVLDKLLADPPGQALLLDLFFGKMQAAGVVLPSSRVVRVLDLGLEANFKKLQAKIAHVAGARGRWLADFNPNWRYVQSGQTHQNWDDAKAAERRHIFSELRKEDPEKALALLRNTWPDENARERQEWYKTLSANVLSDAEGQFLQENFDALPAPGTKDAERPIQIETRKLLAETLFAWPGSSLFRAAAAAFVRYFSSQKTMLGLGSKIALNLPVAGDDFWNETTMSGRFGFEKVSPHVGCSEPEFWFAELVRCLHPSVWEPIFGSDWPKIVDFFAENSPETKKKRWPLLKNLSLALARSRHRPGASAFLKKFKADAENCAMLRALNESELEQYFREKDDLNAWGPARALLLRPDWVWSPAFSRHAVERLCREENAGQNADFIKNCCLHFDLSVIPELRELEMRETKTWQHQHLRNAVLSPLLSLLETRNEIEKLR